MRTVHLLISASKGALPVLLAVTVAPMAATCATTPPVETSSVTVGSGGAGGEGGKGGMGGEGGFLVGGSAGFGGSGGQTDCPNGNPMTFTVQVPPEGTPADPGQICAITMDPVTSNFAAKVTLTKSPNANNIATGFIAVDPALQADIIGLPTITVDTANDPQFNQMQVSNIMAVAGGFSFDAEWPLPFNVSPYSWESMSIKVAMVLRCDPQAMTMRLVESITYINLCEDMGQLTWVSSGNVCNSCDIIAEMAPSPIVSDKHWDELPLGRVLRLRIVPLARIGSSVLLFAENDGGDGLSYSWYPSAGTIERVAEDLAIWTPPNDLDPHLIQVSIFTDEGAAVATYSWREPQ